MAPIASLSTGVIARIMNGEDVSQPVLQILGIKRINTNSDQERYRLLMSDGKYYNSYAMLASQLNEMQNRGLLNENTIVRLDKYMTSMVGKEGSGKRVLIVTELTVLNSGDEVKSKIGDPVTYENAAKQDTAPKPAAVAASVPVKKEQSYNNNNNNNNHTMNSTLNGTLNSSLTHPISSLSPYQNKWVIKARVTSKTAIRTWSNARGEGKLFSMDLMDESGEIRATAFKEQCDKFYDLIEVDNVYFFSKCQLKPANKQYSQLKNDYEMTFTNETMVQPCDDEDNGGIPEIKFDLVPISQVANMENKEAVDTIGICKDVGELQTFTSRTTNKEFKKRELTLVDMSNAAVTLTLWGDEAVNFDGHVQPVILVKGSRINEFNGGKSLSMGGGSILKINPDIPEAHKLRGWFDNGGGDNISNMVSARTGGGSFSTDWVTLKDARLRNLGSGDKPDYFQCKAVVHIVKQENAFYKACPQADCNKKVVDEGNGQYRCERCNAAFPNFKYRLLINMSIGDWTSNRWVTCFSETGEQLLKHNAQEVGEALENDPAAAEKMFADINFSSYIFKLRCKNEMYGDMTRNKLTVQSMSPINYKEYNKHLIKELKEMTGIGPAH
ncbi:replication protein A 70 kDa DNA-binding subunit [Drosophila novamexicana]|uniref:replication protein A 70 kDa DNA-binding subunit n=1 Tax=Drosophila novamexicana TaxID=47314 RepID=UPI0011E5A500|nr:replication protein A 70 kDa DNA-binding subunit [Drosophila novamexicana]